MYVYNKNNIYKNFILNILTDFFNFLDLAYIINFNCFRVLLMMQLKMRELYHKLNVYLD